MIHIFNDTTVNDKDTFEIEDYETLANNRPVLMNIIGKVITDNKGAYRVTAVQDVKEGIVVVEDVPLSYFKDKKILRNGKIFHINEATLTDIGIRFDCTLLKEDK